jgi:hypothetical protein
MGDFDPRSLYPETSLSSSPYLGSSTINDKEPYVSSIHQRIEEHTWWDWVVAYTPLVLHFIVTVALSVWMLGYIDGRLFHISHRRQEVLQADGTPMLSPYVPLQTDIITVISVGVTLSRIFGGMWSAATLWRCLLILMEKKGMTLYEMQSLLRWQVSFHYHRTAERARISAHHGYIVAIILFALFPSQFTGPLLTGSISWSQNHELVPSASLLQNISVATGVDPLPDPTLERGEAWVADSLRYSLRSYPDIHERGVMKLAMEGIDNLPLNSRLANITLPYFSVKSIRWVANPVEELTETQLKSVWENESHWTPWNRNGTSVLPATMLIPDWWFEPYDPEKPVEASLIEEERLLASWIGGSIVECDGYEKTMGTLPPGAGVYRSTRDRPPYDPGIGSAYYMCFIFARVKYVAGAAECTSCRVSRSATVLSDEELHPVPHALTRVALHFLPTVSALIAAVNASVPSTYNNFENYVSELLSRSYVAEWTNQNQRWGDNIASTSVEIAVEGSKADIERIRVYLWLSLNLLVSLSGLVFILLLRSYHQPLVVDPLLALILLDPTDLQHREGRALCNFSSFSREDERVGDFILKEDEYGHRKLQVI